MANRNSLANPLLVGGVEIWINPTQPPIVIPVQPASALGVAQVSAGLPNDAGLAGQSFYSQFLMMDAACGFPNFTGSQGLALSILP